MISPEWPVMMARYNRWQNQSLYGAAGTLADDQRRENRGAFFGSLHTTLAHIQWADRVWLSRLAGTPPVAADSQQGRGPGYYDWKGLIADRKAMDDTITDWATTLTPGFLASDFTWTSVDGTRTATLPAAQVVTHFFNHQTHHRGQAHALLTALGARPDDTDLIYLPKL